MQKCPLGCPYARLKQMECPSGCPSSGQIRIKCPLTPPSTGKCVEVLSWVSFQWTKRGKVRIKVPYQCKNMLKFPSHMIKCCPFNGQNQVESLSGCPSSGTYVKVMCLCSGENMSFCAPFQWKRCSTLKASKCGKVPYRGGLPVE